MIARWTEQGPWAGGPLCFSSSSGWERLMDPNWTHIYCTRFSWSVMGVTMLQLEPLTGWLCLPFWKVIKWTRSFFFHPLRSCLQSTSARQPTGNIASCFDEKDDGGSIRQLSWGYNSITILLAYERDMPGCVKQPGGWETSALRCLSRSQRLNTKVSSLMSWGQNVSSHGRHAGVSEPAEKIWLV